VKFLRHGPDAHAVPPESSSPKKAEEARVHGKLPFVGRHQAVKGIKPSKIEKESGPKDVSFLAEARMREKEGKGEEMGTSPLKISGSAEKKTVPQTHTNNPPSNLLGGE